VFVSAAQCCGCSIRASPHDFIRLCLNLAKEITQTFRGSTTTARARFLLPSSTVASCCTDEIAISGWRPTTLAARQILSPSSVLGSETRLHVVSQDVSRATSQPLRDRHTSPKPCFTFTYAEPRLWSMMACEESLANKAVQPLASPLPS